jgi:hypothetical protein
LKVFGLEQYGSGGEVGPMVFHLPLHFLEGKVEVDLDVLEYLVAKKY